MKEFELFFKLYKKNLKITNSATYCIKRDEIITIKIFFYAFNSSIILKIFNCDYAKEINRLKEKDKIKVYFNFFFYFKITFQTKKDEILSNVSHDLRTPLNGINFILARIDELTNCKEIKKFTNLAKVNSELLLNLISDLLDYSLIKEGKIKMRLSKVKLKDIIDSVMNLMDITAKKKKISLKENLEKINNYHSLILMTDERRLKQV